MVGAAAALVAYRVVNSEARELLDNQLRKVANVIAAHAFASTHPIPRRDQDMEMAIWGPGGKREYASTDLLVAPTAGPGFAELTLGGARYRVFSQQVDGRRIEVAQAIDVQQGQAKAVALAAFLSICVLLPLLSVVIAFVIRAQLKPVQAIAEAVSQRAALATGALQSQSLPEEIAPLVEEINRLLDRQVEAVQRERHFIVDAAHALRTPLAALQLQADVLEGSRNPLERSARLLDLEAGIARATRLSQQLLSLARIEAAVDHGRTGIAVNEALDELQRLYEPTTTAARIRFEVRKLRVPAAIRSDSRSFMLICGNLLDNALRYTPAEGRIEVVARADGPAVLFEILDEGPGLPPGLLDRVLERFYCAPGDPHAGTGLGLATVKSLLVQLGGRIELRNRADRPGLAARVWLPQVESSDA